MILAMLLLQAGVSTTIFDRSSRLGFLQLFQLESLATVSVGSSLSSTTGSVGLFGIFGRSCRLLLDDQFGWSN